jgi:DNA-binding response OmpR family regulator
MNAAQRPRVLIAEDEACLAFALADMLEDAGYDVVPMARLADVERAALDGVDFDVAILDINLAGELVYPVVPRLRDRGWPILFASAYGTRSIPAEYGDVAVLQKPYDPAAMLTAVAAMVSARDD